MQWKMPENVREIASAYGIKTWPYACSKYCMCMLYVCVLVCVCVCPLSFYIHICHNKGVSVEKRSRAFLILVATLRNQWRIRSSNTRQKYWQAFLVCIALNIVIYW